MNRMISSLGKERYTLEKASRPLICVLISRRTHFCCAFFPVQRRASVSLLRFYSLL